ncbi:MAG: family N-acetyltransferase [Paenibacillus sp.]|jgi:GNAT superfamily N-acetyltransferase|nr:family N-acetyltransferase [Paenibacillus sp.]
MGTGVGSMELHISNQLNNADKAFVRDKMIEFNLRHFPEDLKGRYQEVNLFLKNADGQIFGGMVGEICWNWLEIHYLFVDDAFRKLGYGKKLLSEAEKVAKDKKCDFIKLDTLSFQALDFYIKQGFEVFGTIQNAGRHTHYYLKKEIRAEASTPS